MCKFITTYYTVFLLVFQFSCTNTSARESEATEPLKASTDVVSEPVDSVLSESMFQKHRISSEVLEYDLQYWVHLPKGYTKSKSFPTLYVTDGKWYKEDSGLPEITDELISDKKITPIITIYVDAFDPDKKKSNRRNAQFLCNPKYVEFYKKELIPAIDEKYSTNTSRELRGMLGVSFGGLNSMYFGIHAKDVFGKIGIQSPAPHPCPGIYDEYLSRIVLPIEIFLSTGTVNDKAKDTRRFKKVLDDKGYTFKYMEVPEGHNWKNWTPLLDDVLLYFYGE